MASDDIQNLLKSGIQAARSGNKAVARGIFEQVIQLDSQSELAWMWLASVVENPAERQRALQRVLTINPKNEKAQQALEKLGLVARATPARPSEPPKTIPTEAPPPEPAPQRATTNQGLMEELRPSADKPPQVASPRPRQGNNNLLFLLGGLVVVIFLAVAGLLAVFEYTDLLDPVAATATPIAQRPTILVTTAPTVAPVVVVTRIADTGQTIQELPAAWTPSHTPTSTATVSPTPRPSDPDNFEVVFSSQENPAETALLQLIRGGGADLQLLDVSLSVEQVSLNAPTATPAEPEQVSPGDLDATAEPEIVTTETVVETPRFTQFEFIDPTWSPDGQQIAFTAQISPTVQELFIWTPESGRLLQLTQLGASRTDGADWSPNGEQITFSSNLRSPETDSDTVFDIYVVTIETGVVTNLTNGFAQNREPVWSPDGNQIAFSSDRNTPNELEIWVFSGTGGEATQLTNDVNSSFSPAFSADGTQIAFISNRGGDNDLYVMNADGTDERLISINDNDANDRDPAWSPDDNWLMVSSTREDERVLQLWVLRPNGTEWQKITTGLGNSRYPDWRPVAEQN